MWNWQRNFLIPLFSPEQPGEFGSLVNVHVCAHGDRVLVAIPYDLGRSAITAGLTARYCGFSPQPWGIWVGD